MYFNYNKEDGIIKKEYETIFLSRRENIIFGLLYESDSYVTMEQICDAVNDGYMFSEGMVRTWVCRLRKTLSPDNHEFGDKDEFGIKYVREKRLCYEV